MPERREEFRGPGRVGHRLAAAALRLLEQPVEGVPMVDEGVPRESRDGPRDGVRPLGEDDDRAGRGPVEMDGSHCDSPLRKVSVRGTTAA